MQQSSGFTADPVTAEPLASRQRSCDPQQLSRNFGEGIAGLQPGPVVSTGNGQLPFYQPPGTCAPISTIHSLQDLKLCFLHSLSQLSTLSGVTAHRAASILTEAGGCKEGISPALPARSLGCQRTYAHLCSDPPRCAQDTKELPTTTWVARPRPSSRRFGRTLASQPTSPARKGALHRTPCCPRGIGTSSTRR